MKRAIATWKWSLGIVARSPLVVVALAAIAALWGYGAYQWLWLPESSALLLILALLWAIVQIAAGVGVVAATAAGASSAVAGENHLTPRSLSGFNRRQYARALGSVALAGIIVLLLHWLFALADERALEVASFLTFHAEKGISPESVGGIFRVIEWLVWIAAWGFLLSLYLIVQAAGWGEVRGRAWRTLKDSCWRASFFSSLLTLVVFGSLAWLLSTWHPKAPAGFWDYAQTVARLGISLVLIVVGWLFWMLSLARLNLTPENPQE